MNKVNAFTRMWAAALFLTCCLAVLPQAAHAQLIPQLPTVTSPMPGGPTAPNQGQPTPPAKKTPAMKNPLATPAPTAAPDVEAPDTFGKPTTFLERQLRQGKKMVKATVHWALSMWGMFSTFAKVAFLGLFAILRVAYYLRRQKRNIEEAELERLGLAAEPEFGRPDQDPPPNWKEMVP